MPHDGGMMIRTPDPISCPARHAAVMCQSVTHQPVTCQPVTRQPGTRQPVTCRPAISGPPGLGRHLPRPLLAIPLPTIPLPTIPLLSMPLLAMLLLTSLAGCAMTGDDRMALATGEQSATPHSGMIESDDNTITFEFGVGMTGPTRVVAVTSSSSIPATSDDDAYLEYLARQKIAEWRQTEQSVRLSSSQLEARRRAARRVSQSGADTGADGAGEAATDWAENTRITPQEPATRADLIVRRLSPDGQTAPTILKVIQE